jgi:hypothetical protein
VVLKWRDAICTATLKCNSVEPDVGIGEYAGVLIRDLHMGIYASDLAHTSNGCIWKYFGEVTSDSLNLVETSRSSSAELPNLNHRHE